MAIIRVLGSSIFFYVLMLVFPAINSISEAEALLKLRKSFTNASALDSWKPGAEPCAKGKEWIGVVCYDGVASGISLGNLGLSGKIDVDALVALSRLRSVSFVFNAFSGAIPDFHRMGTLKGLFLSGNRFSGEIPSDYFTKLKGLKKVWLSGNEFSGQIPLSLGNLSHLIELHLEDNQFSGDLPPLVQPSLVSLNVSNNRLEGEIPSGMSKFGPNSFDGNPGLCGGSVGKACNLSAGSPKGAVKDHTNDLKFSLVLAVAGVVFLAMLAGIIVMKRRQDNLGLIVDDSTSVRSSSAGKREVDLERFSSGHQVGSNRKGSRKLGMGVGDIVMINDEIGEFGMADLMKAAAEVLGNGALGSSYKAIMAGGCTVVVKRIKEMSKTGRDQFDAEMRKLGSLKHKNVLPPLAYHYRRDEKLLVYEHQPKGSLLCVLHGDQDISHAQLNWPARFNIIQGIARGLAYLHAELSSLDLPHGNLKSSNVLLTPEYEPLLADYGLCSLINSSHAAQALIAYKSPEAILDHQVSPKCDVFCLGVIILEILTGKFPYVSSGEDGADIVQWVKSAIDEGRQASLFDPHIASTKDSIGEMEKVLHIGVACTESNPDQRLDITEAIRRIEGIHTSGGELS